MLEKQIITEAEYRYIELGEGSPVVILHGLMGGLSNFEGVINFFPNKGYKILVPELPVYELPLINSSVKSLAEFLHDFLNFKKLKDVILLGNSLGGHVALLYTKCHPDIVKGLIITGSSGLYENAMGDGYPKRGDYDYIKAKSEEVFYDPKLAIAKSAIRHNMAKDLPNMKTRTAIIWGAQDGVTPPNVAKEFNLLLPNSDLYWIDKCGHAPMMEHPERFNEIMYSWMELYNL